MILVTGCAGFIGSHLTEKLLSEGYSVIGIDNFNDYYNPKIKEKNISLFKDNSCFTLVRADITDWKAMETVFSENKIEKIVHLAARAGVRASFENPKLYRDVNISGTLNLLDLSVKYGVKQFVFASSSSVYGLNKPPFSEEQAITNVLSPYAETKKEAEFLCRDCALNNPLSVTCLRFFTVYGPRGRPDMAVFKFTDRIEHSEPIEKYGKGDMKRDFTFIGDIVQGVVLVLEKEFDFEIINLGNNSPVELNKLIRTIEEKLGKTAKIIEKPVPVGDVPITFADISKAKRLLGWAPSTDIDEGIEKFIEWFKVRK